MSRTDPITREVVRNSYAAAAREMGLTLRMTACTPVFNEGNDFSCGIFDVRGRLVSHGEFLPIHLGSMPFSVRYTAEEIGVESLRPGDAIVLNDPYRGGSHLPDVTVVTPIFYRDELVGYAGNRAHHYDVGGTAPGSFYSLATENYQEGLRIPPVKLVTEGRVNRDVLSMILANVRLPRAMRIDLLTQVSANRTAAIRLTEMMDKYGMTVVTQAAEEIMDGSERLTRAAIRGWPDGDYVGEDYLDNDGILDEPVRIRVTVRVRGDAIEVDFAGSSPQTRGPLNCVPGYTAAGVYMVIQAATDPMIPPNDGCYRPVRILAPEGSIVNPRFPAACTGGNETTHHVETAMFRALCGVPRVPGGPDVIACDHGSSNNMFLSGTDPRTGERYVIYTYPEGGWGGKDGLDGLDGVFSIVGNTWNVPVEAVELRFPLLVERYELRPDSGGPGRFRGGLGIRRDYRVLEHRATLSFIGNRAKIAPWGVHGGRPGGPAFYRLDPGTPRERPASPVFLSKGSFIDVEPGQVVSQGSAGGGGFGDPCEREPERVRQDVIDGYVSLAAARRDYGVVLEASSHAIDWTATRTLRQSLKGPKEGLP